jgi:hypothetical protein
VRERVRGIALKPEAFTEYLTRGKAQGGCGFERVEELGGGGDGKEFSRMMLAFYK